MKHAGPGPIAAWGGVALAGILLLVLGPLAVRENLRAACDVDQWPHFEDCHRPTDPQAQREMLRQRIARNPGDSANYVALALLDAQSPPDDGTAPAQSLDLARRFAPANGLVQQVAAQQAMAAKRWPEAVAALVGLVEHRADPQAARALASLLREPEARAALVASVQPGSTWVEPLLRALGPAGADVLDAMPVLIRALARQALRPESALAVVDQLRGRGAWRDAQALWLHLLGRPTGLIYNGGFDLGFLRGGFDWEFPNAPPSRTGFEVQQPQVAGAHDRALALYFNGRPLAVPPLSQVLVLFPGRYRFTARHMTRNLRAGEGLSWTFSCVGDATPFARSEPLRDTGGHWTDAELTLDVPATCAAVRLALMPQQRSDGLSGLRGELYLDDLRLVMS